MSGESGTIAVDARLELKTPGNQVAGLIPVRPQSPTAQRSRKAELHGAVTFQVGWDGPLDLNYLAAGGISQGFKYPWPAGQRRT